MQESKQEITSAISLLKIEDQSSKSLNFFNLQLVIICFQQCLLDGRDFRFTVMTWNGTFHHYENTPIQVHWKFYHQKKAIFQIKNSNIFHISAQNIDCGYSLGPPRRGGSNEYPQSMFLSRNNKNNVYPCKPQFYYIKVGFKGVEII